MSRTRKPLAYLRSLRPEELKLGQGFPEDYIIDHDYTGKEDELAVAVAGWVKRKFL